MYVVEFVIWSRDIVERVVGMSGQDPKNRLDHVTYLKEALSTFLGQIPPKGIMFSPNRKAFVFCCTILPTKEWMIPTPHPVPTTKCSFSGKW